MNYNIILELVKEVEEIWPQRSSDLSPSITRECPAQPKVTVLSMFSELGHRPCTTQETLPSTQYNSDRHTGPRQVPGNVLGNFVKESFRHNPSLYYNKIRPVPTSPGPGPRERYTHLTHSVKRVDPRIRLNITLNVVLKRKNTKHLHTILPPFRREFWMTESIDTTLTTTRVQSGCYGLHGH